MAGRILYFGNKYFFHLNFSDCSPWQPEFFDWAFNLPRNETLEAKWKAIPDKVDILVSEFYFLRFCFF